MGATAEDSYMAEWDASGLPFRRSLFDVAVLTLADKAPGDAAQGFRALRKILKLMKIY